MAQRVGYQKRCDTFTMTTFPHLPRRGDMSMMNISRLPQNVHGPPPKLAYHMRIINISHLPQNAHGVLLELQEHMEWLPQR